MLQKGLRSNDCNPATHRIQDARVRGGIKFLIGLWAMLPKPFKGKFFAGLNSRLIKWINLEHETDCSSQGLEEQDELARFSAFTLVILISKWALSASVSAFNVPLYSASMSCESLNGARALKPG